MITDINIFNGVEESHHIVGMDMINDENYYDDRSYITNSMLGKLKESPATLKEYLEGGGFLSSSALSIGDAVHKAILEPEKFETMVKVWDKSEWPEPDKTLRTKANKEWMNNFKEENKGMCILEDKEFLQVKGMIESILSKPKSKELLSDAVYEQISLAKIAGIPVKSKGDIVKTDGEWIIDIKTSSDIRLEAFKESCEKYGYYRQAGMYTKMFKAQRFAFLVVEKKAPYRVAFYEVSQDKLNEGWEEACQLIEQFKYFFSEDPLHTRIDESIMEGVL